MTFVLVEYRFRASGELGGVDGSLKDYNSSNNTAQNMKTDQLPMNLP